MYSSYEYGFRIVRYFIVVGRKWGWEIIKSLFIERSYNIVIILEGIIFDDWKIVIFKIRN